MLASSGRPNQTKQRFKPNTSLFRTAYISKTAIQAELFSLFDGLDQQNGDSSRTLASSGRPISAKQQFKPNFSLFSTAYISKTTIQAESFSHPDGLNLQNSNSSRTFLSFRRPNQTKQRFKPNTRLFRTAWISNNSNSGRIRNTRIRPECICIDHYLY